MLMGATRVNGDTSTIALTSSGARAAAMLAEPPANECPMMTAGFSGPPRCLISASRSAAVSARV
jgi:hypothetical protein